MLNINTKWILHQAYTIVSERNQVKDIASINSLWKEYASTLNRGDIEAWLSLWLEDGLQMPPDSPQRQGRETIRKGIQPYVDQYYCDIAVYPEKIWVSGDAAYSHGNYEWELMPKSGGETLRFTGMFLTILKKQMNGAWKIAVDCFNVNTPDRLPPGKIKEET
jgi:uncharacterized protein (TIGR02246 family)